MKIYSIRICFRKNCSFIAILLSKVSNKGDKTVKSNKIKTVAKTWTSNQFPFLPLLFLIIRHGFFENSPLPNKASEIFPLLNWRNALCFDCVDIIYIWVLIWLIKNILRF